MLTREQIEQQLMDMRQQERALYEQWTMSRGAVQMLEHLLSLAAEAGEADNASPAVEPESEE